MAPMFSKAFARKLIAEFPILSNSAWKTLYFALLYRRDAHYLKQFPRCAAYCRYEQRSDVFSHLRAEQVD